MEGGDLQEVVMERQGKFEVMSAVDLQAAEQEAAGDEQEKLKESSPQTQQHTAELISATSERAETETKTSEQQESSSSTLSTDKHTLTLPVPRTIESEVPHIPTNGPLVIQSSICREELERPKDPEASKECRTDSSNESNVASKPQETAKITGGEEIERNMEDNGVEIVVVTEPTISCGELKPKSQFRTKSAPGSRAAETSRRKRETDEEQQKRRKMSEAAFAAWVRRKDTERRNKERAELKSTTTEETKRQRREMSERVYKNWVESKNQMLKTQRLLSRPSTSVPKKDEEECRRAFESWLERKRTQQFEEVKRERLRTQELEELAKKADTSITDKVYKE